MPNPHDIDDIEFDEEVDLTPPEPRDDEPREQESRRDRRNNRAEERERERKELEERAIRAEAELEALRRQPPPQYQPPPAAPSRSEEDEIDQRAEQLYRAREEATEAYMIAARRDGATEESLKPYRERIRKASQEETMYLGRVAAERAQREAMGTPEQQAAASARNHYQRLMPDIVGVHPPAESYIRHRLSEESHKNPNLQLTDAMVMEWADEARAKYGLGKYGEPSDQMRSANAGFDGSGGGGGKGEKPFRMTKADMQMADAWGGHIDDPAERYRAYAKMIRKG